MITRVKICDNCKRSEDEMDCSVHSYKVKRENLLSPRRWEKVDICFDCLLEIRNIVKNKGRNTHDLHSLY